MACFILCVYIVENSKDFIGLAGDGIKRVVQVVSEADGDSDEERKESDRGHDHRLSESGGGGEEFSYSIAPDHCLSSLLSMRTPLKKLDVKEMIAEAIMAAKNFDVP